VQSTASGDFSQQGCDGFAAESLGENQGKTGIPSWDWNWGPGVTGAEGSPARGPFGVVTAPHVPVLGLTSGACASRAWGAQPPCVQHQLEITSKQVRNYQ